MKNRFLVGVLFFIMLVSTPVYGQNQKVLLLLTDEYRLEQWMQQDLIAYLIPASGIGYMSTRVNHKEQLSEYYGGIGAGRRINYTEINAVGAVENGLGDILHQNGFSTAFFGKNPLSKMIVADHEGRTTYDLVPDWADERMIEQAIQEADLAVFELDTLTENYLFYQILQEYIHTNSQIIYILSPYNKGTTILPVLRYNPNDLTEGLLTSPITRRQGIITNIDIMPSVLNDLGIHPEQYTKGSIVVEPDSDPIGTLQLQTNQMQYISNYRSTVIREYTLYGMILLLISPLLLTVKNALFIRVYRSSILTFLWVPSILLVSSAFAEQQMLWMFVWMLAVWIGEFWTLHKRQSLIWIGSTTVLLLIADVIFGSKMQQGSFLGYDPFIGARFYGIGNEYAGVLMGSVFLFLWGIEEYDIKKPVGILVSILGIAAMGLPFWGANVGGTIAMIFGITVYWVFQKKRVINMKILYRAFGFLVMGTLIWLFVDLWILPNPSHLGQIVLQFLKGDQRAFVDVFQRKFLMNLTLIYHSLWTKFVFVSSLVLVAFRKQQNSFLSTAGVSLLIAMMIAILVNDSGIIMASICMIYLVFPTIYLYNQEEM